MSNTPDNGWQGAPPPPPSGDGSTAGQPQWQQGSPQHDPAQQAYGQQAHQQQGFPAGQYGGQYGGQPQRQDADDKVMGVLAHLSAPIAFIVSAGSLSFLGPLIIWFLYKDRSPFVRQAAAGSFNFNLAFWAVSVVLVVITLVTFFVALPITLPLEIIVFLVAAWSHIKGAIKAGQGEPYKYPFQIRVLS